MKKIHKFENGIKVDDSQLLDLQRQRYKKNNLHEPEEEAVFRACIKALPNNGVFVNIGSAIGYYLFLAQMIRSDLKIAGVEPLSMHRRFYNINRKLNGVSKSDIRIFNKAISSDNGNVYLWKDSYGSMIHSRSQYVNSSIRERLMKYKKIKSITLEDLVHMFDSRIDLLQMDIQGLENQVLASSEASVLQKGLIKRILIGTHGKEIHDSCREILKNSGYYISADKFNTVMQPDGILLGVWE